MTSAPLLDIFGKGYRLPKGGAADFLTPYGTAGVRFDGGDSAPVMGAQPMQPVSSPAMPTAGGLVRSNPTSAWSPVGATGNSLQRWRDAADAARSGMKAAQTDRFYERKQARDLQAGSSNPAVRDFYRQQRAIVPSDRNIPGYGTPAQPSLNVGAIPPVSFNQPGTDSPSAVGTGEPVEFVKQGTNEPSAMKNDWTAYF